MCWLHSPDYKHVFIPEEANYGNCWEVTFQSLNIASEIKWSKAACKKKDQLNARVN